MHQHSMAKLARMLRLLQQASMEVGEGEGGAGAGRAQRVRGEVEGDGAREIQRSGRDSNATRTDAESQIDRKRIENTFSQPPWPTRRRSPGRITRATRRIIIDRPTPFGHGPGRRWSSLGLSCALRALTSMVLRPEGLQREGYQRGRRHRLLRCRRPSTWPAQTVLCRP